MVLVKTLVSLLIVGGVASYFLVVQPAFNAKLPDWCGHVVCVTLLASIAVMVHNAPPAMVMVAINILFVLLHIIKPKDFFDGFGCDAVISTGTLTVFADAVYKSGALDAMLGPLLPPTTSVYAAIGRVCLIGLTVSTFLNNVPVMAMMLPLVEAWANRNNLPLRLLLMPCAYAIFLGAMNTVVASSCNLTALQVAKDLVGEEAWGTTFTIPQFFSPGLVGIPTGLLGVFFLTATAPFFLGVATPSIEKSFNKSFGIALSRSLAGDDGEMDLPPVHEMVELPGQPLISSGAFYYVMMRPVDPAVGRTVAASGVGRAAHGISLWKVYPVQAPTVPFCHPGEWAGHTLSSGDLLLYT
uniref:Citrate transporter-like domain-containing protein n=1 Tax=Eutreptiella gymnastica TaxID=73025 RepID=A0A7S1IC00_9EUGL